MIQFAYIILYVKNVEKSIEFYEKAFGFSRKFLASSQKIGIGMLDITAGANFNKSEIIGKHLRLPISYLRMLSEKLSLAESKSLEL